MNKGMYECLKAYADSDFYPFHMPGHKRNPESGAFAGFYGMDITEIDGFDNLHQPESLIRDAQTRAAGLYHSEETFFLVNGSTAGILSAISAISVRADRLIIARNCHRAVYYAAFLNHLKLYYLYPDVMEDYDIAGPVRPEQLKKLIEDILSEDGTEGKNASELIAGVVITSPTYDGITSDAGEFARTAHEYGIPLIVDQAHGAHFGMHPSYPPNAVAEGADMVIHSVHKTLPAPTQTALIHRNGNLTDGGLLRKYLRIYQSSSPSYLLMAGIDEAIRLTADEGAERLEKLLRLRQELLHKLKGCRCIRVCPDTEPGKLVISVKGTSMTGQMLYDVLREKYHLQMEMASGSYVLAILTMMDNESGFQRLLSALLEIDETLSQNQQVCSLPDLNLHPKVKMDLREAYLAPCREVELSAARGLTAAEFVNLYPPGIPILVPGEEVSNKIIETIESYREHGYTVQGINKNKIKTVKLKNDRRVYEENKNYMYHWTIQ